MMVTAGLVSSARGAWIGIATSALLSLCCFTPTSAQQAPPGSVRPIVGSGARGARPPRPTATGRGGAIVITSGALARRARLTDALADIPGLRLTPIGAAEWTVTTTRSPRCVADIFVDRLRVGGVGAGPFEIDLIPVQSVERIEIYPSAAWIPFEIPHRDGQCAAIIIRLKRA
jgi:hypothetical protein